MDYVRRKNNNKVKKVKIRKSEMEWESDRLKLIQQQKILEMKYNFKSKSWVTKMSRKTRKIMPIKSNKTIFKCKEISKAKCIPKNKKNNRTDKVNLNQLMSRWVM